jgi:hypothetical protein
MTYSTSNPPVLVTQPVGGGAGKRWLYRSTDDAATVDSANYFTNGGSLGMAIGDLIDVIDTDASPPILTIHQVSATGDGTTDVNNSTTVTQTDSD